MSTSPYDAAFQNYLRLELRTAYRRWVKYANIEWVEFLYTLSILRAFKIPWSKIGKIVGKSERNTYLTFTPHIYPDRSDLKAIVASGRGLDDRIMQRLAEMYTNIIDYDAELFDMVAKYREQGASWKTIGSVLGVSGQAAEKRFGVGTPTPGQLGRVPRSRLALDV